MNDETDTIMLEEEDDRGSGSCADCYDFIHCSHTGRIKKFDYKGCCHFLPENYFDDEGD